MTNKNKVFKVKLLMMVTLIVMLMYRIIMMIQNWNRVKEFYMIDRGSTGQVWLMLLPFIVIIVTFISIWVHGNLAVVIGIVAALASILIFLYEGITSFARMMDRYSDYVGSAPLASLLCTGIAIFSITLAIDGR